MTGGQAFMFTPGGAIPITQEGLPLAAVDVRGVATDSNDAFPGAITVSRRAPVHTHAQQQEVQAALPSAAPPSLLSPRAVVKAATARARQLKTELNRIKRLYRGDGSGTLERELAELERLIAAAKQKPLAVVRNIDHARHAR